jgi:hypothetical protein
VGLQQLEIIAKFVGYFSLNKDMSQNIMSRACKSVQNFSVRECVHNIVTNFSTLIKQPRCWGFVVSIVVIALVSMAYFYPDAGLGNELRQHDMQQGAAIGHEAQEYMQATGAEQPRWTNSLFSGMPTFQISPTYPSDSLFSWITKVYGGFLPAPANLLFMMMLGFLILMASMRVRWYYGLIGALAWGFSTYFIIIIGAGHIWKFVTLAYVPPTVAGVMLAYRGRYLAGSALAAIAAMMQIQSNHVQMSYYFLFVIVGLAIAYLVQAVRSKEMPRWTKATASLAVAALLAVAANLPSLYNTYKYSKETMRGTHSELTATTAQAADEKTGGLDRDYITQYSYGRSETFSLLIPNIKGGASVKPANGGLERTSVADLDNADEVMTRNQLNEGERQYVANYVSQYFGEPEGTNGPVYVGAIVFALFLLGCFIVRGPVKWALVVLTLLSLGLALGRNMMWLTNLFIDYVPMYAKFRTVESILVIAEFTMPLLAVMALYQLLVVDGVAAHRRALYASFGISALLCLAAYLAPAIYGPAISAGDQQLSSMLAYQLLQAGYPQEAVSMFSISNPSIAATVETLRFSMVKADALRSLLFIVAALALLLMTQRKNVSTSVVAAIVGVLIVADLYPINKRYLNHNSFCSPQVSATDPFPLSATDRAIKADTAMNYRVMDIPGFYSAAPSYHHKAIGGYHAAKLTRYQDLIDRHLAHFTTGDINDADLEVLNMLNARYLVDQEGKLHFNDEALGNAWFVDHVTFVDGADAEMDALDTLNPATEAVADKQFRNILANSHRAPGDTIFETSYAPDRLTYSAQTRKGAVAVFSEVYFPWGWDCTIDGKPAEIARVNYLLRAVAIPAGHHTVTMTFRPASVSNTVAVARIAVMLIYLMVAAAIIVALSRRPRTLNTNSPT